MKKLLVIQNNANPLAIAIPLLGTEFEVMAPAERPGLAEIELADPALIMIDYILDGCLGTEVCLEIKQNPATQRIPVFLFAEDDKIKISAYTNGADAFISKPFETAYLAEMIRSFAL